jgi:ABC-type transport system involved in cytochrome c biogenesis permease subunit
MLPIKLESLLISLNFISLVFNMLLSYGLMFSSTRKIGPIVFLRISNLLLVTLFIERWISFQQFPISNLYESLLFLVWILLCIQLFISSDSPTNNSNLTLDIGPLLSPLILLIYSFAVLSLPTPMQELTPLLPALQSNWLVMHVTFMLISYGFLIAGSMLSITFLFLYLGSG